MPKAIGIIGWARHLYHRYQGIVLKINRGLAGEGIVIINQPGLSDEELAQVIKDNTEQMYWEQDMVVVERYFAPDT